MPVRMHFMAWPPRAKPSMSVSHSTHKSPTKPEAARHEGLTVSQMRPCARVWVYFQGPFLKESKDWV